MQPEAPDLLDVLHECPEIAEAIAAAALSNDLN